VVWHPAGSLSDLLEETQDTRLFIAVVHALLHSAPQLGLKLYSMVSSSNSTALAIIATALSTYSVLNAFYAFFYYLRYGGKKRRANSTSGQAYGMERKK